MDDDLLGGATEGRRRMAWTTAIAGVLLFALLAVVLAWWDDENEQRLLQEKTDQAGVVLTVSINQFFQPLTSLAATADATDGDVEVFSALADGLMSGSDALPYSTISLVDGAADEMIASRGETPMLDSPTALDAPRDGTVAVHDLLDRERTLGFAVRSASDRYVVYGERHLTADPSVRQRNDGPYADLDYAIYLGTEADTRQLLGASTPDVPLDGRTAAVTVPYGDRDILIVTSPIGRLGAPLLAQLWWIVLLVGLAVTSAIALLLDRLQTSRRRAIALARLNEAQHREQRDIAETLQLELLPQGIAPPPGLRMATRYWVADTASLIGGDTYDVFRVDDHRWAILVGDVCGKGTEAAALTGVVRHTIRTAARYIESPAEMLLAVHAALAEHRPRTFCTAALMIYRPDEDEPAGGELTVALGGHPPPLMRTADGSIRPIGRSGTILGLIDPALYDVHVRFDPGSTLLAYTDGLTDAPDGRALSVGDLHRSLAASDDVEEIANDIRRRRVEQHAGGSDDTAVLVLAVDLVPRPTAAVPTGPFGTTAVGA